MMKRLLAIAAFLLASSTAQAQYSFEYGGRTIRIDPDRGTVSIPGVYDNTIRKPKRPHGNQETGHSKSSPQEAKSDPQAPPSAGPADTAAAPATATPAPANSAASPEPSTATANNTPTDTAVSPPLPQPSSAPVLKESVPAPRPEPSRPDPSPTLAAVPPSAPAPAPAAAAVRDSNSPLGVWLTEEKEGKVRIEQCGANLCGYSVDAKSNLNGEQVLINMRPNKDAKWSGRILDPNTGSTYDSTIALKGDVLRVQGCAFGGMFCGGQTWTRVN
jgi:uncharacterized protein (DUF2147 family)